MGIIKLKMMKDKNTLNLLNIAYNNIVIATTKYVVTLESKSGSPLVTVIELHKNGIKEIYTGGRYAEYGGFSAVIFDRGTIVTNDKEGYLSTSGLVKLADKFGVLLLVGVSLENGTPHLFVLNLRYDTFDFIGAILEMPIKASASVCSLQFIDKRGTIYGISNAGKLMVNRDSLWVDSARIIRCD